MCSFLPDMIVEINKIGYGKIIKVMGQTVLVSIDSMKDLNIELPLTDIKPLSSEESFTTKIHPFKPFTDRKKYNIDSEENISKKTIEALRFGVVPEKNIKELTINFDELSAWAESCIDKCINIPCGFEISAPYGTGKSHTLCLIRYIAREKGFLTVRAELDGQNISLSNPEMLLNNLWSSLPENDIASEFPLIELYKKVITNSIIPSKIICGNNDKIKNNLTTIYNLWRAGYLEQYSHILDSIISSSTEYTTSQALKMIKAHNVNKSLITIERMIGQKIENRASNFIESLAGHAALIKLAGYKGLIVTLDEFEIEYIERNRIKKITQLLETLHNYFKRNTDFLYAPMGIFFAAIDQEGQEGDPIIRKYIAFDKENRYHLKIFNKDQLIILAKKIYTIYCKAYSLQYKFNPGIITEVENLVAKKIEYDDSGLIRSFIKWYLSLLDMNYGPPESKIA